MSLVNKRGPTNPSSIAKPTIPCESEASSAVSPLSKTESKAIPCGASKHGIFSYSDSTYSVSATLRVSKHVIFRGKYSDSCPSTEYRSIFRRRNIDDGISTTEYRWWILRVSTTVHDCYSLQSCMVVFRMGSTFFIAFFSDFGRNGFVEN